MRLRVVVVVAVVAALTLMTSACSSDDSNATNASTSQSLDSMSTTSPPPPSSSARSETASVLVDFPTPSSVDGWINVDDTVMGGVSASERSWLDLDGRGALVFTGLLSTESNGGFASILGPSDRSIGQRAAGARSLRVSAVGDGRTYVLQLRAGPSGAERWIARFTPPTSRPRTDDGSGTIPIDTFTAVDRFLRPVVTDTPLDPSTIVQIGVYVLDGQIGEFRLTLEGIDAVS